MSIEYVELTIEDAAPIEITISDIPEAGVGGINWQEIYARTTDPGIEGEPWNDNGLLRFSAPNLNFSLPNNSMYIALIIEDF